MQSFDIILSEMADNAIRTGDRHRKTTAIALKIATDAAVVGTHREIYFSSFLLSLSHFLGMFAGFRLCTTLCCQTGCLCLTSLSLSLLTGFLVTSSTGFSLCLLFPCLCLGNTTSIFASHAFSLCFLASQLSSTLLGSLSLRLTLGFSSGTSLLACHFLGYQTVNLCIEGCVFLLLLRNDILDFLLLFLQSGNHVFLLGLLALQRTALALAS